MSVKLTAVFRRFPEGYAASVEELPGANSQEAVTMVLEANRQLTEEELEGQDVIREPFAITPA